MDPKLATDFLDDVNARLDAVRVLERIGYFADKAQVVGDSVKAMCPIHRDSKFRSLMVDSVRRTYKCTLRNCPAHAGGTLVELYATSRSAEPLAAASELAGVFGLEVAPEWNGRFAGSLVAEAREAFGREDHDAAEEAARRALAFAPTDAGARLLLVDILMARGESQRAHDEYAALVDTHLEAKAWADADSVLDSAAAAFPDSEDLTFLRLRSAEGQNRLDDVVGLLREVAASREAAGRSLDNIGLYQRLIELDADDETPRLKLAAIYEFRRDMRSAVRELERAATMLVAKGRGAEAMPLMERVLKVEPRQSKLRLALAEEQLKAGDTEGAKANVLEIANQHLENGDYNSAAATARRWLETDADAVDAYEILARIQQEQGLTDQAATELMRASEAAGRLGDNDGAMGFLFRVKFLRPEDTDLRHELVRRLQDGGQPERAAFELLDLSELLFNRGDAEGSEAALLKAAAVDPGPAQKLQAAELLEHRGRSAAARDLIREAALAFEEGGDSESALVAYTRLLESDPADLPTADRRARLLWTIQDHGAASATVTTGAALLAAGRRDLATSLVSFAGRALAASPDSAIEITPVPDVPPAADALRRLFDLAADLGDKTTAITLYGIVMPLSAPVDPRAALGCASRMARLCPDLEGPFEDAAGLALELGESDIAADSLMALADMDSAEGRGKDALRRLGRACEIAPDRLDVLRRRVEMAETADPGPDAAAMHRGYLDRLRETSPDEAVTAYDAYILKYPADAASRRQLADLLARRGRGDDAARRYSELLVEARSRGDAREIAELRACLLALDPDDPELMAAAGRALREAGDPERARPLLLEAARRHLESGRASDAADEARLAVVIAPDDVDALRLLALAEEHRGETGARIEALHCLAEAFAGHGRLDEAIATLRILVELQPDEPAFHGELGACLDRTGQAAEGLAAALSQADLLQSAGEADNALAVYESLGDRLGGDLPALRRYSALARRPGMAVTRVPALTGLASAFLAAGGGGEAAAALDALDQYGPEGRAAAAPVRLRLARSLPPGAEAVEAFVAASAAFTEAGLTEEAIAALAEAVALAPDDQVARGMLADTLQEAGRGAEAFPHRLDLLRNSVGSEGDAATWRDRLAEARSAVGGDHRLSLDIVRILHRVSDRPTGVQAEACAELETAVAAATAAGDDAGVLEACLFDDSLASASRAVALARASALHRAGRGAESAAWLSDRVDAALANAPPDLSGATAFTELWLALAPEDAAGIECSADVHRLARRPQPALAAYLAAAERRRALSEPAAAIRPLRQALEIDFESIPARDLLWRSQLEAGREADALPEMRTLADILESRGDHDGAIALLEDIVARDPESPDTRQHLATILHARRGFDAALPHFRHLLAIRRRSGPPADAAAAYEAVLRLPGAGVELRAEYADFLADTGLDDQAKKQLLIVAKVFRERMGEPVRAIEYYGRAAAIAHSPDDAPIFESLAELHLELKVPAFAAGSLREAARLHEANGHMVEAVSCARQALELTEESTRIDDLVLLGNLLARAGRKSEAADRLRDALALANSGGESSPARRKSIAFALLEAEPGNLITAETLLDSLRSDEVADRVGSLARAFEGADRLKLLARAKLKAPDSIEVRRAKIDALREGSDDEALARELEDLVRLAARQTSQRAIASEALSELVALPATAGQPLMLAPLYALVGDREKAVAQYALAAKAYAADGMPDEALDALRAAVELDAGGVPADIVAGLVRQSGGHGEMRELASRVLESALRARGRTRALLVATALLEFSSREEVRALLAHIAEVSGAAFAVAIAGAFCDWLNGRGRDAESADHAVHLTTIVPNSPDAWWLAGQKLRADGQAKEAADASMKAARLFGEAGAITEEEGCYRDALGTFPDDLAVLETLASFYERERRGGDALQVMGRLAELLAETGDNAAALAWYRRMVPLAPGDEPLRARFAQTLTDAGRRDEAAQQWREAARGHAKKGNESDALGAYEKLVLLDPEDESAVGFLLDHAVRSADQPAIARYTIAQAVIKAESGALGQACTALRNLLMRDPDNTDALERLAEYGRRGQDGGTFRTATLSLGHLLVRRRDHIGAIIRFESLLESSPGDLETLQTLVECCAAEGMAERGADFAADLLEAAKRAGDMPRVRAAANAILDYDPERGAVRRDLAEALLSLNRLPEAIAEWTRAAEQFLVSEELAEAVGCVRRVTDVAPMNLTAWKRLGDYLYADGETDAARDAYLTLADRYADAGDVPNMQAVLRRILTLDPEDPIAHGRSLGLARRLGLVSSAVDEILWLVRHHLRESDLSAAERMVEQGVQLAPDSLVIQQCRLEILRKLGRVDELRIRLRELADGFLASGDPARAVETLESLLEVDSDQPAIRRELGQLHRSLGNEDKARDELARLVQAVLDKSDPEEARDTAEALLAENPGDIALRARLAEAFVTSGHAEVGGRYYAQCAARAAETGDVEAHVRWLRLATQARPRWSDGLRLLAEASAAGGDTESAAEGMLKLIQQLVEAKQITEAIAALKKLVALRPKEPAHRIQLVDLHARLGDREGRAQALRDLGDLQIILGKTDLAIDAYRELANLRPDDPEVLQKFVELFAQVGNELEILDEYLRLAEAYTKRGLFVEATSTYEQILAIDRRNPVIREKFIQFLQNNGQKGRAMAEMRRLADVYTAKGNKGAAISTLTSALALSPKDAELCLRLAAAHEEAGNRDLAAATYARAAAMLADTAPKRAIELYTKLLEADPDNTEIRRRLAEALARAGEKSQAATHARRLAEIHAGKGEMGQAEAAYQLAADNRPVTLATLRDSVSLHAHDPNLQYLDLVRYGDALAAGGEIDQALDQYRKARSLNDSRAALIQKCIDALNQIAPEREAVPDMLTLAERHMTATEPAKARKLYDQILRLDPACGEAKRGRTVALQAEATMTASSVAAAEDQQLKARQPKKARMGVNELMGALDTEPPATPAA